MSVLAALIASVAVFEDRAVGQTPAASKAAPDPHRAFLNTYCVGCHNAKLKTGGLALDGLDVQNAADNAEVWEKAVRKLTGVQADLLGVPDRGYLRPGAWADVVVCAPSSNQSATSHSLTLHRVLHLRRAGDHIFHVDGTPADCVYVALHSEERVLPRRPPPHRHRRRLSSRTHLTASGSLPRTRSSTVPAA